ncbi:ewing's tumor-associated antigen 1 [Ctenodactylus gundi]
MPKMDSLTCPFNSPNDPDGQNDIFWDQNSPMTKQLGKRRKKQFYTTDSDEISHIVNRIAPQDEKPTTDSMLGIWIGETAIPCTPSVAKEKSREKIRYTKLKTQNREKELMKLAKQFDKNMEELDVIQEQNKRNRDCIQSVSETQTLCNCKDFVQVRSLCDVIPQIDNTIRKKPMEENTRISVANDQASSQKPFDLSAEAAFNAIFDGSTQKCCGQLSQDLSDAFLNDSNTTIGKKSPFKEEKIITHETLVTEKLPLKAPVSLHSQERAPITKSCVTPNTKELETSDKSFDTCTTSDFEDDWESLLSNETFAVQNVELVDSFPSKTAQCTVQKESSTFISKNDESTSRMNTSLDARLGESKSKILKDIPSNTHYREPRDTTESRFSPNPHNRSNKLPLTGNKVKFEKPFNKIQKKTKDSAVGSHLTKENAHTNLTSSVNVSENKPLNTSFSGEAKKPSFSHSFKTDVNIDSFGSAPLGSEASVSNPNQASTSKLDSLFDDWNDPSFASEVVHACRKLETTWEADDVDDDLLYQACDDIERLSQQGEIQDSKMSASVPEIKSHSRHGVKNMFFASKQGCQLVQSKHLNLGSALLQTPSLTDNSQIRKSVKMVKGEMCGNSPDFLGAATDLTVYSMNSKCENNVHASWNNSAVPINVNSAKSVLVASSKLNVNTDNISEEITTTKKLSTQLLSHRTVSEAVQSDLNKKGKSPKYTFTKMKNSTNVSQFSQNYIVKHKTAAKIIQNLEKKEVSVKSLLGEADQQKSLQLSESLKESSKEDEEKNRKYSPEEIQRKRQEALVRRMAKAQASPTNSVPSQFL